MKKILKLLLIFLLSLSFLGFASCNKTEPTDADQNNNGNKQTEEAKEYSYSYKSMVSGKKYNKKLYYTDDYFINNSTAYNPSLASASCSLSIMGSEFNASSNDLKVKHINDFYKSIGYDEYSYNDDLVNKPTATSFGVSAANKKLDDYTLISVIARGSDYEAEWISNFKVGNNDKYSEGFFEASEIYLNFLKNYIKEKNITGNIKIWTAGYSRAGAAINLAIGRIDEALANNQNLLENVNYKKEDIYAYCFEAPAGVKATVNNNEIEQKNDKYNNIFNIVNLSDVVPMVAPKQYKFARYGIDYFLPNNITTKNYYDFLVDIKEKVKTIPNYDELGDYKIDSFSYSTLGDDMKYNWTMGKYLIMLVDDLVYGLNTLDNYVANYEEMIGHIFSLAMTDSRFSNALSKNSTGLLLKLLTINVNEVVVGDEDEKTNEIYESLKPEFKKILEEDVFKDLNNENTYDSLKKLVRILVRIIKKEKGITCFIPLASNTGNIKYSHYGEITLAHLELLDKNYNPDTKYSVIDKYYVLEIETESEFDIKLNNTSMKEDLVGEKVDNKYIYYIPADANYSIEGNNIKYSLYEHNNRYFNDKLIKNGENVNSFSI